MKHYQTLIIGGGPGGYEAAIRLNQYGLECAVIEQERIGGICLNLGCIPTKALVRSSELWHDISQAPSFGLDARLDILDYQKVFSRKNEVVEKLVSGVEFLFNKRKIPVLKARAVTLEQQKGRFVVSLENAEPVSGEYVIIATGSVPKELPGIKIDEQDILSSTGILKLDRLPSSLAVVGGGVVGCEFASIFASFGVEVHLIEFLPGLVSTEDEEVAKRLQMFLKKSGIRVRTGTGVNGVSKDGENLVLKLTDGTEMAVEKVLLSVGRIPAFSLICSFDLIKTASGALEINQYMLTNVPNLYAIGDVTGRLQLAHTASQQGLRAAEHIRCQVKSEPFVRKPLIYENIPRCIFTDPEVGSCGLSEQQASEQYGAVKIGKFPFTANGKALAGGNVNGFVKVIAAGKELNLVGMHIIGPNAAELIAQGSILINLKVSAQAANEVVFAHPTLSEAIMEALEDLHGLSIHKM